MRLIMFNTVMGVLAGLGLMLVPRAWAQLRGLRMPLLLLGGQPFSRAGWAAALAVLGVGLYLPALVMTIWHPLSAAAGHIDTLFGEPSYLLALLLLAAAWYLVGESAGPDQQRLRAALAPVSWVVFWLGVVLAFCAAAIIRFTAVGAAPAAEPVTGLLQDHPMVENLLFGIVLYGLSAVGCLAFPAAVAGRWLAWQVVYWSWTIAGFCFAAFSALNFYTHTGMLINLNDPGPDLRW